MPRPPATPDATLRSTVLAGLTVCLSGSLEGCTKAQFVALLEAHGAAVSTSCSPAQRTTHLVVSQADVYKRTAKVKQALKNPKVVLVPEQFVLDSLREAKLADAADYSLDLDSDGGADGAGVQVVPKPRAASAAAARAVMLAEKWDDASEPAGLWMSEKLDGVRAYWDGSELYSRNGLAFPAPAWFKAGLPDAPLDGELWCGRQRFRRAMGIVKNACSAELWQEVRYLVFDAPDRGAAPFEARLARARAAVVQAPYAKAVGVARCDGAAHLARELAAVEALGGEGLMLRAPGSPYETKRSKHLLKVKSFTDEEARVVAHEPGKGQFVGLCGALMLETPDGRRFACGSGMTLKDRRSPPALAAVVTYRYTELADSGVPRFPRFVGQRVDIEWASYCTRYEPPAARAAKLKAGAASGVLQRAHSLLYSAKPAAEGAVACGA